MVIGWCIVDFLKIFIIFHGYFDKNVSQKPNSLLGKVLLRQPDFIKLFVGRIRFSEKFVAKSEFLEKCCCEIRIFEKMLSRNPKFGVVLKFSGLFKYPYVCLFRGWWVQGTFFPNFTEIRNQNFIVYPPDITICARCLFTL